MNTTLNTRPANDNANPVARRPSGALCAVAPGKTCSAARVTASASDCPDCG